MSGDKPRYQQFRPSRAKVVIVNKSVPHYRRRFFELLRRELEHRGIELRLIHGDAVGNDALRADTVDLPWASKIANRSFHVFGKTLIYQDILAKTADADLVVVEQASKLLSNYLVQARYLIGGRQKLAFWGHGKNRQPETASFLGESIKAGVSTHVHWWFAYTESSAATVRALGFPASRITVVGNSIDTKELSQQRRAVDPSTLELLRRTHGIAGTDIGIYTGGMYEGRRLPFLLKACEAIRVELPTFQMLFVGGGPESGLIERAASEHAWIKYFGPKFGLEKAALFALAKVNLMPGVVGLGVLDSFAMEVPLITTAVPGHGPEIDYLQHGENGLILEGTITPSAFAATVTRLLNDDRMLQHMREGCRRSAAAITIESMVANFAAGIEAALAA